MAGVAHRCATTREKTSAVAIAHAEKTWSGKLAAATRRIEKVGAGQRWKGDLQAVRMTHG